jgi:DNA-binding CsgD family transcriptional regulator
MQIEYLSYIATFIISSGLAVIGILISYQLYQSQQKQLFQILLYQQIFLFSFFIYGIWGNLAIRETISDFNLSIELSNKLAVFIPVLGIPFLMVSWFMLLKFGNNLNGFTISKSFTYSYFPVFIIALFVPALLLQKGYIKIPGNPDLFIIRIIVLLNLAIHLFFIFPFLKPKGNALLKEFGFRRTSIFSYFTGVILYSILLSIFNFYGFVSTCFSIILLFAVNIFFPVFIKLNIQARQTTNGLDNMNFESFCSYYEISRREAEIILEICSGKTNKAISEKLFITLQTVKDHTHRIYTKTGVKSRVQLSNLVREKTGV